MHRLCDLDTSRRFPRVRLATLREHAIRAAIVDSGPQATWLGIEHANDYLATLPRLLIRVLAIDGDPVGFGAVQQGATPRLTGLYVHPAYQRRGHGRQILAGLADDLQAAGAVTLATAAAAPARPFYLALGFKEHFAFTASPINWEQGPRMHYCHMSTSIQSLRPTR